MEGDEEDSADGDEFRSEAKGFFKSRSGNQIRVKESFRKGTREICLSVGQTVWLCEVLLGKKSYFREATGKAAKRDGETHVTVKGGSNKWGMFIAIQKEVVPKVPVASPSSNRSYADAVSSSSSTTGASVELETQVHQLKEEVKALQSLILQLLGRCLSTVVEGEQVVSTVANSSSWKMTGAPKGVTDYSALDLDPKVGTDQSDGHESRGNFECSFEIQIVDNNRAGQVEIEPIEGDISMGTHVTIKEYSFAHASETGGEQIQNVDEVQPLVLGQTGQQRFINKEVATFESSNLQHMGSHGAAADKATTVSHGCVLSLLIEPAKNSALGCAIDANGDSLSARNSGTGDFCFLISNKSEAQLSPMCGSVPVIDRTNIPSAGLFIHKSDLNSNHRGAEAVFRGSINIGHVPDSEGHVNVHVSKSPTGHLPVSLLTSLHEEHVEFYSGSISTHEEHAAQKAGAESAVHNDMKDPFQFRTGPPAGVVDGSAGLDDSSLLLLDPATIRMPKIRLEWGDEAWEAESEDESEEAQSWPYTSTPKAVPYEIHESIDKTVLDGGLKRFSSNWEPVAKEPSELPVAGVDKSTVVQEGEFLGVTQQMPVPVGFVSTNPNGGDVFSPVKFSFIHSKVTGNLDVGELTTPLYLEKARGDGEMFNDKVGDLLKYWKKGTGDRGGLHIGRSRLLDMVRKKRR